MASPETLQDLLIQDLRDLLDGETQITKALPKMAKAAESEEVRDAFEQHLRVTEEQIQRLNQAFELIDERPKRKTCQGIQGLIEEAKEMMQELDRGPVLDAALVAAAQKVEHYEIAAYGTVRTWASLLNRDDLAQLFEETLNEEKSTDEHLTEVAESMVNPQAAENESDEDEVEMAGAGAGRGAQSRRGASAGARRSSGRGTASSARDTRSRGGRSSQARSSRKK